MLQVLYRTGKDIVKALVKKGLGQAVVIEYPMGAGEITVLVKARYDDKATRKKVGKKAKSAGGLKVEPHTCNSPQTRGYWRFI